MADQQNPVQDDATQTSSPGLVQDDALGDISISIPDAPAATPETQNVPSSPAELPEIGDIVLDMPAATPDTNTTASSPSELPTSPSLPEAPISQSVASIDLGDISLASTNSTETNPSPTTTPEAPTFPQQDNFASISLPDAPIPEAPAEAKPVDNFATIDMSTTTPIVETTIPTPEKISLGDAQPVSSSESAAVSTPIASTPNEEKATQVDHLVASEQTQLTTPTEITQQNNEMTLDLDSLTSDLGGNNAPNQTPVVPATASVTLPAPVTPEQTKMHSSSKKRVVAMAAAFVMLLIVAGFVFKTMMPDESNNLIASIFGAPKTTPTIVTQTLSGTTETTGDTQTLSGTTEMSGSTLSGETMSGENISNSGSVILSGDTTMSGSTDTMTGTETNTGSTPMLTKDEAHDSLLNIFKESRKGLAVALKTKDTSATQILYKAYKDTINLLKTLANTNDISTIPDVQAQIHTLQQSLDQAHSTVNGSSNDTQS